MDLASAVKTSKFNWSITHPFFKKENLNGEKSENKSIVWLSVLTLGLLYEVFHNIYSLYMFSSTIRLYACGLLGKVFHNILIVYVLIY